MKGKTEQDWHLLEKREAANMLKTAAKVATQLKEQRQRHGSFSSGSGSGSKAKATNAGVQRQMVAAFGAIERAQDASKRLRSVSPSFSAIFNRKMQKLPLFFVHFDKK